MLRVPYLGVINIFLLTKVIFTEIGLFKFYCFLHNKGHFRTLYVKALDKLKNTEYFPKLTCYSLLRCSIKKRKRKQRYFRLSVTLNFTHTYIYIYVS